MTRQGPAGLPVCNDVPTSSNQAISRLMWHCSCSCRVSYAISPNRRISPKRQKKHRLESRCERERERSNSRRTNDRSSSSRVPKWRQPSMRNVDHIRTEQQQTLFPYQLPIPHRRLRSLPILLLPLLPLALFLYPLRLFLSHSLLICLLLLRLLRRAHPQSAGYEAAGYRGGFFWAPLLFWGCGGTGAGGGSGIGR